MCFVIGNLTFTPLIVLIVGQEVVTFFSVYVGLIALFYHLTWMHHSLNFCNKSRTSVLLLCAASCVPFYCTRNVTALLVVSYLDLFLVN